MREILINMFLNSPSSFYNLLIRSQTVLFCSVIFQICALPMFSIVKNFIQLKYFLIKFSSFPSFPTSRVIPMKRKSLKVMVEPNFLTFTLYMYFNCLLYEKNYGNNGENYSVKLIMPQHKSPFQSTHRIIFSS